MSEPLEDDDAVETTEEREELFARGTLRARDLLECERFSNEVLAEMRAWRGEDGTLHVGKTWREAWRIANGVGPDGKLLPELEGTEDPPRIVSKSFRGVVVPEETPKPKLALVAPLPVEEMGRPVVGREKRSGYFAERRQLDRAAKLDQPRAPLVDSMCACGHPASFHDDNRDACAHGRGNRFGGCPCAGFHKRRGTGIVDPSRAKAAEDAIADIAREHKKRLEPAPLSNLALIRSHEERALAALAQLGAGSWLAYDIAWKSDELSVDEVVAALKLAEKRGRCRKVQAGRTTRWALVARRSDDAESK